MEPQRPCRSPCGFSADGGAPIGGVGGTGPEMCPSDGARLLARLIAPRTTKITSQVSQKSRYPPRVWPRRNKTPTVMRTAGPMKLRITHRWHLQRIRSLIKVHPNLTKDDGLADRAT